MGNLTIEVIIENTIEIKTIISIIIVKQISLSHNENIKKGNFTTRKLQNTSLVI